MVALAVLVALVAVIGFVHSPMPLSSTKTGTGTSTTPAASPLFTQIKNVTSTEVPVAFPADIPWETGVKILQNFQIKNTVTGKTQSTRVYDSAKTVDQNFTIYQSYLKNGGWVVKSALSQPNIKNLDAAKGSARMTITIGKDPTGKVMVNVTYTN